MLGNSWETMFWEEDGRGEVRPGSECLGRLLDRVQVIKSIGMSVGSGSWIGAGWGHVSGCRHHRRSRMMIWWLGEGIGGVGVGIDAAVFREC